MISPPSAFSPHDEEKRTGFDATCCEYLGSRCARRLHFDPQAPQELSKPGQLPCSCGAPIQSAGAPRPTTPRAYDHGCCSSERHRQSRSRLRAKIFLTVLPLPITAWLRALVAHVVLRKNRSIGIGTTLCKWLLSLDASPRCTAWTCSAGSIHRAFEQIHWAWSWASAQPCPPQIP